jgi:predicted GH43/DUF377 family glycosyl hydrolase
MRMNNKTINSTFDESDIHWKKLGLVYDASKHIQDWAQHSALTPTPFIRSNGDIRVFAGFRDANGISRIGYVDIDAADPTKILAVSKRPVLDIGREGCFDDNGVILGDIVKHGGKLYLFYVGFQLVSRVKFLAFTGLAVSDDDGDSFKRVTDSPILDRHQGENYFAAVHTAFIENDVWKLWYGAGDAWQVINGNIFPSYGVHFVETANLLNVPYQRYICLTPSENQYRIGRPRVYRTREGYIMHFTAGTLSGEYFPGIAHSSDGIHWNRGQSDFPITLSGDGWDSRHLSYPAILALEDKVLLFYNGNDMGRDGFGVAECRTEECIYLYRYTGK